MKVALLLTGQLRTYDMVKDIQMNCLIHPYDTDVFMSIDLDNSLQTAHRNPTSITDISKAMAAIEFFKPLDYCITDSPPVVPIPRMRQYLVVKKAYELLKNYKAKTNTTYDLIIRLRFDQILYPGKVDIRSKLERTVSGIFNDNIIYNETNRILLNTLSIDKKILLHHIEDNIIHVFGFGDYKHYKYVNDQFYYHNESLLNSMYDLYDNIPQLSAICDAQNIKNDARTEYIFYLYLQQMGIIYKRTHITGEFVRAINNIHG